MDRDHRWERTERAYALLTDPDLARTDAEPLSALTSSYDQDITDEFLEPVRVYDDPLRDGDALLMFNFRPDRARQIVSGAHTPGI
jgi:2,3-bisphosphoglycerate-independent phosphoglycerate mutase